MLRKGSSHQRLSLYSHDGDDNVVYDDDDDYDDVDDDASLYLPYSHSLSLFVPTHSLCSSSSKTWVNPRTLTMHTWHK